MAKRSTQEKQVDPVARLLAGSLDDFTAARDALAKELAAAGDAQKAKEVKALRRPTVSAWAVNRLAHEASEELEALFEAADRVRGGKGDALREAMRERTAAHARVLAAARSILEAAGHAAQPETLRRVGRTLHAAEVGAGARARVESGLVTIDLDASLLDDDDAPPKSTPPARAEAKKPTAAALRAEKETRERERRERAERHAETKRAEHEADVARRSMEAAERRLAHAKQSLESAQRAVEAAEDEAREARRRHDAADRAWRAAVAASASNDVG